jgi:hypothetical protein
MHYPLLLPIIEKLICTNCKNIRHLCDRIRRRRQPQPYRSPVDCLIERQTKLLPIDRLGRLLSFSKLFP